jgi:ferric-dicitrate binding protein FerR (iron transport regulator)
MNIDEIRALLDRYQKGNCTDEERKAIEAWYDALQLGEQHPLRELDVEASLARVRGKLGGVIGEAGSLTYERRVGNRRIWRIGAAAAIALFAIGSIWWFRALRREGAGESAADSSITISTGRGETRQVILPDGSTLLLNAATVFRYPEHFGRADRTVNLLKGEVFLQVAAQPGAPFVVVAGKYRTKVLGTSFDIRAYDKVQPLRIAVLSGKVCVSEEGRPGVVLEKGMLLRGDGGTDNFDNDYDVAAWKEGAFYFKDASFEEIAFEIGNRYNIGLVNKSKKQLWSYTGLFRSESLQEVIETICQTENLGYVFSDNAILIVDK